MSGFGTEQLLYPLTKGDKAGHDFHGNQYREVGGEGNTTRPPVGKFQLSHAEMSELANIIIENPYNPSLVYDKGADLAMVYLAKQLGYDKPATIDPNLKDPNYFRGCDKVGAESLTQPLTAYGKGGGTLYGAGVYLADSQKVAEPYVPRGDRGALMEAKVDTDRPDIMSEYKEGIGKYFSKEQRENFKSLSDDRQEALKHFSLQPSQLALMLGYRAFVAPSEGTLVVLDRSILKVAF